MTEAIQSELDTAEKFILDKVFGDATNIELGTKVKMWFLSKNLNADVYINEKIKMFEAVAKDYITPNGYVDGNRLTEMIVLKCPVLKGCIALPTLKPVEYAQLVDMFINFEALGKLIK